MHKFFDALLENFLSEEIFKTTLDNGLTVIAKEDPSAKLSSVHLWAKTGSIHENSLLGSGISHYLEHMLFKGTKKRNYKQISQDIQKAGGHINAYTTFDHTAYHVNGPSEATEVAVDVLSDIALNSIIDPHETKREQSVILREIDMDLDDPDAQFARAVFQTAFQKHPYRYSVIGERSLFKQITQTDLKHYYKSRYSPNNMVLIVVGAIKHEDVLKLAKKYFAGVSAHPTAPVFIPNEPVQLSSRHNHVTDDLHIVRGCLAYPIPSLTHRDSPALDVLANVLGQGHSSILWQHLREKKNLVHSISASAWNPGSSGLFWISYVCDPGQREAVEEAILKELKQFQHKGVTEKILQKALRQSMVNEINNYKTMSAQAVCLGTAEVIVGDLNYTKVYLDHLKQVSQKTLQALAKEYFKPEKLITASLGPKPKKASPCQKPKGSYTLPKFEEITLKNGLRLCFQVHKKIPKINIFTASLGGPLYEPLQQRGVSALLAALLTKDTQKRSASKIAETIEALGGSFSEFSGNNTFGLALEVMNFDFLKASDLLQQAFTQIKPSAKQFTLERNTHMAQIKEELDDITAYGFIQLRKKFFGQHPYQIQPLGTLESLKKLTLKDVNVYQTKFLDPSNLVFSLSGDFDPEIVVKTLSLWLEKIPSKKDFSLKKPVFKGPQPGHYEEPMDKEQVVVFQAYPGLGVINPSLHEVSDVMVELLSGMSSRLFVKVREEQGMAYFVGANHMLGLKTGMFYFYAGTNAANYKKVFKAFDTEIKRIQEGKITNEEIQNCKTRLKVAHQSGLQTSGNRAMKAALDLIYGLPVNRWKTYDKRIDAVSKKSLQAFANKHFIEASKVSLAVGPV